MKKLRIAIVVALAAISAPTLAAALQPSAVVAHVYINDRTTNSIRPRAGRKETP